MENQIAALQALVDSAKRIAFFGGAGVSTASGIPDFRGSNGLYRQKYGGLTPEMMLSHSFFYMHPDIFYDFYRTCMIHPDAAPNAAHLKLAELEKAGKLSALITQNIDGLHKQAGNRYVYELHGSVHENQCIDCGHFYPLDFIMNAQGVPKCPDCGGVVKPSVVLYGEPLDHYVSTGACREISRCDLLIIAGTSLTVEPAASMIDYFRADNRRMVIINRSTTPADNRAGLVIRESVEKVMEAIHVNGI